MISLLPRRYKTVPGRHYGTGRDVADRAILDADRHLFGGRHLAGLRRIFRAQGIGPGE